VALITISAGGENSIVVVPGANGMLLPEQLEKAAPVMKQAGFLLTQLEIPLETVEYLATFAEQHQIPLMLDPAPARDLSPSLLRKVEWLTPNETETEILLRRAVDGNKDTAIFAAADELLTLGARNVLLKLGARGCLVAEKDQDKQFIPAFLINAVDSTAAGDAFNAAFAVALLRGQTSPQSAQYACAVAGIAVSRYGAQPSMPTSTEVEEFIQLRR
jgi:ribokinase